MSLETAPPKATALNDSAAKNAAPSSPDARRRVAGALATLVSAALASSAGCGLGVAACDELDQACNTPVDPSGYVQLSAYRQRDRRARPMVGGAVRMRNLVVTAIDDHVENSSGNTGDVWVQERVRDPNFSGCVPHPQGGVVCGIQLFAPTILPAGSQLVPGDLVNINGGRYDEFDCSVCCAPPREPCLFSDGRTLPELSMTSVERVGSTVPPTPIDTTLAQIAMGGDQYMGILVRVTDEILLPAPDTRGEYRLASNVNLSTQIGPLVDSAGRTLEPGTRLRNVTGIVSFFFGSKLLVRGPEDYTVAR